MNKKDFIKYQSDRIKDFQNILQKYGENKFDEQGLPAYTNKNILMRWLFWKRIDIVIKEINKKNRYDKVLDFGCGLGVLLPYLTTKTDSIVAFDIELNHLKLLGEQAGWNSVKYIDNLDKLVKISEKFDLILALDVLEHVENLEEIILIFKKILTPGGKIIISGPTENFVYKMGRKLAGYSGDYHVRNINDIKLVTDSFFNTKIIGSLLPGIPFFKIFIGK